MDRLSFIVIVDDEAVVTNVRNESEKGTTTAQRNMSV